MRTWRLNYNPADIEQARTTIGAEAGKFGAVGDESAGSVDAGMFGTLGNSARRGRRRARCAPRCSGEYSAAENLVGAIERTLDSTVTSTGEHRDRQQANISSVHGMRGNTVVRGRTT